MAIRKKTNTRQMRRRLRGEETGALMVAMMRSRFYGVAAQKDKWQHSFGYCGCLGFVVVVNVAIIALNAALLIWVARDAKNRGMDNAALWMIVVMLTGNKGLIIYLFPRPQGNLCALHALRKQTAAKERNTQHCKFLRPRNLSPTPRFNRSRRPAAFGAQIINGRLMSTSPFGARLSSVGRSLVAGFVECRYN